MGLRMDYLHAPTVASGPTSQAATNGTNKKLTLQELIAKKEDLEAELSALGSVLDSVCPLFYLQEAQVRSADSKLQHNVNMNTSLTTFDGYPRADIDVAQIRTTRARIVRLKNDYKTVMGKMEVAVQEQFAAGKTVQEQFAAGKTVQASASASTRTLATQSGANGVVAGPVNTAIEPPFAKVNTVVPGSPAGVAGLQSGDRITQFGSVNRTNHEGLSRVAQVVQQNENSIILVKFLRDGSLNAPSQSMELRLTPRRDWGGRGLLGCHLLPV
ncbi:hypothetical protein LTR08_003637 [Meristemomyces frigidus]|nr:hypothetical protein LTR08_003637 [Meristemomyces frigidus]